MKITKLLAVFSVVCGLGITPAMAQDGDKPERPKRGQNAEGGERPERPGRPDRPGAGGEGAAGLAQMLRRLPLIVALDANSDGVLSKEEIEGATAALKKLDKDGDGKITMAEMGPPRGFAGPGGPGGPQNEAAAGARFAQMFSTRDANGDGKLTGDEIPEMLQGRMERVDENADGAIEKEELMKAMARMGRGDRGPGAKGGKDSPEGERNRDGSGVKPKRPGSDKP